jgi:hypothetical protein
LPLASLSSGLPRNLNVLLIRTHPNPTPSVANSKVVNEKHRRILLPPNQLN